MLSQLHWGQLCSASTFQTVSRGHEGPCLIVLRPESNFFMYETATQSDYVAKQACKLVRTQSSGLQVARPFNYYQGGHNTRKNSSPQQVCRKAYIIYIYTVLASLLFLLAFRSFRFRLPLLPPMFHAISSGKKDHPQKQAISSKKLLISSKVRLTRRASLRVTSKGIARPPDLSDATNVPGRLRRLRCTHRFHPPRTRGVEHPPPVHPVPQVRVCQASA